MKKILNEYFANKKYSRLNILALILSLIICFMHLSFIENKKYTENEKSKNSRWFNVIGAEVNDRNIKELTSISEIDYFFIEYDLSLNIDKKYPEQYDKYASPKLISYYSNAEENIEILENEIAVPRKLSLIENIQIGQEYYLYNKEFIIKEFTQTNYFNSFIINYNDSKKMNLKVKNISIMINPYISDIERENIINRVKNILSSNNIEFLENLEIDTGKITIFSLSLLILTSVLTVIFIFTNILLDRTRQYFIYRFSGMTKVQFYEMLLFEVVLDFIFSFVIATVLFICANEFIIKGIFGILRYRFRFSFILYVFVVYFIVYLLLIVFGIRKYFKKSLMESYKN